MCVHINDRTRSRTHLDTNEGLDLLYNNALLERIFLSVVVDVQR